MSDQTNQSSKFSSKVKRINVELPNYQYFHSPSLIDQNDKRFIGRDGIIDRLKNILTQNQLRSGAYLITGYRGMGKTSFVNNVLGQITRKMPHYRFTALLYLVYFSTLLLVFYFTIQNGRSIFLFFHLLTSICFYYFFSLISKKQPASHSDRRENANVKMKIVRLREKIIEYWKINRRVVIRLNLGHEILNEKDILCLIAKNIQNEFKKFTYDHNRHFVFNSIWISILLFLSLTIYTSSPFNNFHIGFLNFGKILSGSFVFSILWFGIIMLICHFILFLATYLISSNKSIPFSSRRHIINKLEELNDHIDAIVKSEIMAGGKFSDGNFGFETSKKQGKEYPLASVRQLENRLIDILDEIEDMLFFYRPEFIIVFDELDKIDPQSNANINDKEEEMTDFDGSAIGFTGGAVTRFRKQNVLKLLANMKYFITTAKAKFIFISGRELYDAFLADVSDREFSISSIFHQVIYVESFLSDSSDQNKPDIISMTEHYVCQFLFDPEWLNKSTATFKNRYEALTLKNYEYYLIQEYKMKAGSQELNKTIMLLYQFIHYLTHVSNGAPKKVTNLFERQIISQDLCNLDSDFFVGKKDGKTYLSFGYIDQCRIGFIHYLANPIIMAIVNNVSSYGDKLLVSASFLIDHIYKFHNNGFSWRNLEHAPEILDINRTPELRNFISTIIGYLSQTHISPIVSGLYVFKFPKKISEEISFISKISEEASAIFNFTLDESLSIKKHYSKLLYHYIRQYNIEKQGNLSPGEFVHAIADIHHILGDLHLFDEEYTEAIFEYQSSVQYILRDFSGIHDSHQVTHLLFIVRTMLKLGLAFEKRKTVNSAYLAYSELVSMAIELRYIDEKLLGLEYKTEKTDGWENKKAVLFKSKKPVKKYTDTFRRITEPENMMESDKTDIIFMAKGDELIPNLAKITTPLKNKLITRLSLFEDFGLMYQASLAKLFVLEKIQLGGISLANLNVIEGEFLNLHLVTNLKDKFLISSDFFKKLGDIMYYKNGLINNESSTLFNGLDIWGYDVNDDINDYALNAAQKEKLKNIKKVRFKDFIPTGNNTELFKDSFSAFIENKSPQYFEGLVDETELKTFIQSKSFMPPKGMTSEIVLKVVSCNTRKSELLAERNIAPCYACKYYNRSLKILADNLLNQEVNDSAESKAFIFLKALDEPEKFYSFRNSFSQILASTLGGFGDVLVSCSRKVDKISKEFLNAFFKYISEKENRYNNFISEPVIKKLSQLEKAILYYLASAKYYKRSSNLKEAHVMYKKILLLLIQYVITNPTEVLKDEVTKWEIEEQLKNIKKHIIKRIIQCIYSAYEHIHVVEIQKLKWINTQELYELIDLNQLSLFPELEETLYAYYELQIICRKYTIGETDQVNGNISIHKLYGLQALSPFRLNSSIYNRLIAFRFKALLNRKLLAELLTGYDFEKDPYGTDHPIQFYSKLIESINNVSSKKNTTEFLLSKTHQEGDKTDILTAIEHLIVDSIFCLQKFIEIVYPHNKTTLFTNSYIADIYQQLFEWSQLFDFLFMLYAYRDNTYGNDTNEKKNSIIKVLSRHYWNRLNAIPTYGPMPTEKYCEQEITEKLNGFATCGVIFENKCRPFFDKLYTEIDKSNTHLINSNYLAEQGIKKYQNAFAIHLEGKPYKSMIEEMYYLNDDLDNDSFKFYLAMERYRINSGIVLSNLNKLKMIYRNSILFDVEKYLGPK